MKGKELDRCNICNVLHPKNEIKLDKHTYHVCKGCQILLEICITMLRLGFEVEHKQRSMEIQDKRIADIIHKEVYEE